MILLLFFLQKMYLYKSIPLHGCEHEAFLLNLKQTVRLDKYGR